MSRKVIVIYPTKAELGRFCKKYPVLSKKKSKECIDRAYMQAKDT